MKNVCRSIFAAGLGLSVLATASPLFAKPPKTEDQLIQELSSSNPKIVYEALQNLEKEYPTSTKGLPLVKKLVTDPRPTVRIKAARVLGALHADVSETDLRNITALLRAVDPKEKEEGLKALRGLKAQSTVPDILLLLKDGDPFVVRDACRTLAVLGDKSLIPSIEPLLTNPDPKVQKDAQDAIFQLKAKG